ncbi:hypothetical protein R1sor_019745 [Riccia sorocarpa]|uniref:Uncharacterized protein n=1 Tax=Riccia sorocarpa TaxID=122646 RepID=A0ABD3IDD3_9MARC
MGQKMVAVVGAWRDSENEPMDLEAIEEREVARTWNRLRELAIEQCAKFRIKESLLQTVDEALESRGRGSALIFIVAELIQSTWRDRNQHLFRGLTSITPVGVVLQAARNEIDMSLNEKSNDSSWNRGMGALQEINKLIEGLGNL